MAQTAPLRMIIAKRIDGQEYRVEVSGGLTEAANLASIARQAIQVLANSVQAQAGGPGSVGVPTNASTGAPGPDGLVIPEDEVPFEQTPRMAIIKHYAGGKSLKQVFYDAWEAGIVSRIVNEGNVDDLELQRIAEWLRSYRRPKLPLIPS